MFPPIGLGSQQGTGQSLQDEGGPTNPSFPTGPRLAVRRTEEIYQSPATAATPAPNTGNPSALMEHEEDNLQPKPKTSTGQAAEAQRADMKPTEAKKALLELVNSVAVFTIKSYEDRLNLAEGMSSVLDQVFNSDIGRKNPTAKIPASPGLSGSSGVYHKGYRGGDYYPDQTAVFTPAGRPNFNYDPDKVPHPHDHSPEAIRCSLCGPLIQK